MFAADEQVTSSVQLVMFGALSDFDGNEGGGRSLNHPLHSPLFAEL